jgi:putative hydrolase
MDEQSAPLPEDRSQAPEFGAVAAPYTERVSNEPPEDGGFALPFGPGFDLSNLFQWLQSPGPVNWQLASQVAGELAGRDPSTGETREDPPVDRAAAQHLLGLVEAAQTHVVGATGLVEAGDVERRIVTRRAWTETTLDGLHPVLEALASTMSKPFGEASAGFTFPPGGLGALGGLGATAGTESGEDDDEDDDEAGVDLFAGMMGMIAPMLFGVQAGSLVGLLSQHALGQYDLPLPLTGTPKLVFVMANIEQFAHDWSLPLDDLSFVLALREVVHAAELSVPWVRARIARLCTEYVTHYEIDPEKLMERFPALDALEDFDPMEALQRGEMPDIPDVQIDPADLLAGMRTPAQEPLLAELQRFGSVLAGYADAVLTMISDGLVPEASRIEEALRRHRVERGKAAEFVDSMLGLQITREQYDRAHTFCAGVIERAGLEGLNRLWEREAHVPTENELDAPGLWLARLELDLPD